MNPFKENGQILPIASINSVYIDDILASDVFRPQLLMKVIDMNRQDLGISKEVQSEQLLFVFNDCLSSKNKLIQELALRIATEFGKKLASVILTLKKPSVLSKSNRPSWLDVHWDFWSGVKKLYLVGGLTSPILTTVFYKEITNMILNENIQDFSVSFIEGSSDLGTKGLATIVHSGENLLFDFGQTMIKRRHIIKDNDNIQIDVVLTPIQSKFLFYKDKNENEVKQIAGELDKYIKSVIAESVNEVDFKGNSIYISIANYVCNGVIYRNRGGYGKLSYLSDNYEKYLQEGLSDQLGKEIKITLYHDTSAMALNFKNEERTAVISLGTAFGVAFPE